MAYIEACPGGITTDAIMRNSPLKRNFNQCQNYEKQYRKLIYLEANLTPSSATYTFKTRTENRDKVETTLSHNLRRLVSISLQECFVKKVKKIFLF